MKLTLVAAVSKNGVIGNADALPWYIPEDLKHFKEVTMGKACLMGKKTYDSIMNRLKKPLPGRESIVITRNHELHEPEDVRIFHSLEDAYEYLKNHKEVMVIGGGQIYSQTIDKADKLILTEVHKEIDGDVKFPKFDQNLWQEVSRQDHPEFSFVEYERKKYIPTPK